MSQSYLEYDTLIQYHQVIEGESKTIVIYPTTKWGNVLDAPNIGDLSKLTTTNKTSIVDAINEAKSSGSSIGYTTKAYRDVLYAEEENQTTFEIRFPNWNTEDDLDLLTVVSGRLPLTAGEDFTVNGNILTLTEGIDAGRNISLELLRNVPTTEGSYKVKRIRQDMIAEVEGQTVFEIKIENFDHSTDMVTLTSGRTFLTEELDFTIAGNTLTLVEGVPLDRKLALYVVRNVDAGALTAFRNFTIEASNGNKYLFDIDDEEGMTYTKIIE